MVVDGDGRTRARPFLDLRDRVVAGGEQGLLGLAFTPPGEEPARLFAYYTALPDGRGRLSAFELTEDGPALRSRRVLLEVPQPAPIHNGGMVTFGPDGMLYLGLGYGGATTATERWNAQDAGTLLGSILRLDVTADGADPYAIPADNPYADGQDGAPEVWLRGVRNPWRFAFDGPSGLLYVADVGQYRFEEVSVLPTATAAGANLGWPIREAGHCLLGAEPCAREGLVDPVLEYPHADGDCAVVGGVVYRGRDLPGLVGRYVFTDHCSGRLRSFRYADGAVVDLRDHSGSVGTLALPTSFGTDGRGEILVATSDGALQRIVAAG